MLKLIFNVIFFVILSLSWNGEIGTADDIRDYKPVPTQPKIMRARYCGLKCMYSTALSEVLLKI
jgi:hypothetical protein